MNPGFIARLRPLGPWRLGPDSGARNRVERVLHSDRLYSAVTAAMAQLGWLEEWLEAVFRNPAGPAVRFTSVFPFQDDTLFVIPPRHLWPPPASLKVRWRGAQFVPLAVVAALFEDNLPDENRWATDGQSGCLVSAEHPRGPFQVAVRSSVAVDRVSGNIAVHSAACLEFREGAGMWFAAEFAGLEAQAGWRDRLLAALRLLADSGIGGKRSSGWGCFQVQEIRDGLFPDLLLSRCAAAPPPPEDESVPSPPETAYWLLSLLSPAPDDEIDWERGDYSVLNRSGRVESPAGWGELKRSSRMIAEGSVLCAAAGVRGRALNVAPDGYAHPVYCAGYGFALAVPWRVST